MPSMSENIRAQVEADQRREDFVAARALRARMGKSRLKANAGHRAIKKIVDRANARIARASRQKNRRLAR